jgi:hypothetical protein
MMFNIILNLASNFLSKMWTLSPVFTGNSGNNGNTRLNRHNYWKQNWKQWKRVETMETNWKQNLASNKESCFQFVSTFFEANQSQLFPF